MGTGRPCGFRVAALVFQPERSSSGRGLGYLTLARVLISGEE